MELINFFRISNFIFLITLSQAAGAKWPSILKRCTMNDPNLDKCLMKQTQQAIAKASKGLPATGLKSLDPYRSSGFNLNTKTGPIIVNIHAFNTVVTGPSKIQLKKVGFDKPSSTYFLEGFHNHLKIVGNYTVKGSILLIPVDSKGSFAYDVRAGYANHTLKLSNNVRSKEHGNVGFKLKKYKSMTIIVHDRLLGEQGSAALSKLVNDNMDVISRALWDPMEKVVTDTFAEALKPLTSKFSLRDFLPEASPGRSEDDDDILDDEIGANATVASDESLLDNPL